MHSDLNLLAWKTANCPNESAKLGRVARRPNDALELWRVGVTLHRHVDFDVICDGLAFELRFGL
jgi:hypothetical protein